MTTNSLCNQTLLMKEEAIRLAVAEPPSRLNVKCINKMKLKHRSTIDRICNRTNYVADVFLFGYEVDTLEIRLLETKDIVTKTILIESAFDHHGNPKACVFRDIVRHTKRFRRYNVDAHCLQDRPTRTWQPIDWNYEMLQLDAASRLVGELPGDAIVTMGHVDEIPDSKVWWKLAKCSGPLPTNVAVANLHGHAEYKSWSLYGARGDPFSWGSPGVHRASAFEAHHARGKYPNVWLRGGAHLTNYCFAGNRILKEWTATEARPDMMMQHKPSCVSQVAGCRRASLAGKTKRVKRHLPVSLTCNRERFPEWWHIEDPRLKKTLE